jgi:hypothetical protein
LPSFAQQHLSFPPWGQLLGADAGLEGGVKEALPECLCLNATVALSGNALGFHSTIVFVGGSGAFA